MRRLKKESGYMIAEIKSHTPTLVTFEKKRPSAELVKVAKFISGTYRRWRYNE